MKLYLLAFLLFGISTSILCKEEENSDIVVVETEEEPEVEEFIPTKEWQTVKPGQTIPRGLHIRMDLQGGGKQARLPDDDPKEEEKKKQLSLQEIEEALKNIATSHDAPGEKEKDNKDEEKWRSYETLKKELKNMDIGVKTDIEIINELSEKFHKSKSDEEKESILEDLEYYVHQIDNAQHWVALGGINAMALPALNSTAENVRAHAAFLLGSSMQNNPKVQIAAVESGVIPELIRLISFDQSQVVKSRAVYAISGATRRFPFAQMKLVAHGGLTAFYKLFESSTSEDPMRIQLKIVTLLHDLVQEFQDCQLQFRIKETEEQKERLKQYYHVGLEEKVKQAGFCKFFPKFLRNPTQDRKDRRQDLGAAVAENVPVRPEHDVLEKALKAMLTFEKTCNRAFTKSLDIVKDLQKTYAELASHETEKDSDTFFKDMEKLCDKLQKQMATRVLKEEL